MHRSAYRSACARRRSRRRLPRGRAVAARLRVLRSDSRARVAPAPHGAAFTRDHGRRSATTATARRAATGARSCRERRRPRPRARVRPAPQLRHRARAAGRRPADLTPEEQTRPRRAIASGARTGAGLPGDPGHEAADRSATGSRTRPPGSRAWIVEKFGAWSDCDGDVEASFTKRPVAHQHHRVLGHRDGHVVGAPVLRDAPGGPRRDPAGVRRRAHRRRQLPRRGHPHARGRGPSTATTSRTGPSTTARRALRRDAGARPLRRRRPGVLPHRPLSRRPSSTGPRAPRCTT